jgi:4-hydroxyphenylpyruvate dioxygenase
MTNNVPVQEMQKWCDFYENLFNFKETRFFNIKGEQTGLISKVMSSPCQKLAIPINEPTDPKSQIQEYIDEYKGSGIQHIALGTDDIVATVAEMRKQGIEFLDVPDTYYDALKERLPLVTEDIERLKELKILVDGDDKGYLLQIFTKNLFGPIFIEIIQRKKHNGFGEGNFQALFDAIERDQRERGVL